MCVKNNISSALNQLPLAVNENSLIAHKPTPVSLPYDLKQLPKNINSVISKEHITNQVLELDTVISATSSSTDNNKNANEDQILKFKTWSQSIERQQPGFFNNSTPDYVMKPTKRGI